MFNNMLLFSLSCLSFFFPLLQQEFNLMCLSGNIHHGLCIGSIKSFSLSLVRRFIGEIFFH